MVTPRIVPSSADAMGAALTAYGLVNAAGAGPATAAGLDGTPVVGATDTGTTVTSIEAWAVGAGVSTGTLTVVAGFAGTVVAGAGASVATAAWAVGAEVTTEEGRGAACAV
jgi:hypothetical protein